MTDVKGRKSENEIEVTPAMIEAGQAAYYAADRRFDGVDEIVREIYCAMRAATMAPLPPQECDRVFRNEAPNALTQR